MDMLGNLYLDVVITNFNSCIVYDNRKVSTIRSTSDVEAAFLVQNHRLYSDFDTTNDEDRIYQVCCADTSTA